MTQFAPINVGRLILEPLRYVFQKYSPPEYRWDPDAKKTKIDISMFHDVHKENMDHDMAILVDRGSVSVSKTGLSDNLANQTTAKEALGLTDKKNFLMYQGTAGILVKARNEGTVELLADRVRQIIQWSRPLICDTQGFKEFGLPMMISNPVPEKPDVEVFQIQISVPYIMEELWREENDALKLRQFFMELRNNS